MMKSPSRLEDMEKSLKALAQFANLEDEDVSVFRSKYRKVKPFNRPFVPNAFWNYRPGGEVRKPGKMKYEGPLWKTAQTHLRDIWRKQFPDTFCDRIRLVQRVFDPTPHVSKRTKPGFFDFRQIEENVLQTQRTAKNFQYDDSRWLYPYHWAVLFMFDQRWRAKICAKCGNRFVALSSMIMACSLDCRKSRRRQQKNEEARKKEWYWPQKKARKKRRLRARSVKIGHR